jgi:phosphotransferase system HPr (HPr) family protein
MTIHNVIVRCKEGLHLRIASKLAKIAQQAGGSVQIGGKTHPRANACSVMELLTLGASSGTPLEIVAGCPGEEAVLSQMAEVFEEGSGI